MSLPVSIQGTPFHLPAPERRGTALLHWLNGPHVRPYFHIAAVTTPNTEEEFIKVWDLAQGSVPGPMSVDPPAIEPLPDVLQPQVQALLPTRQFEEFYRLTGVTGIVSVELGTQLVTPQVWVDEEYIDELSAQLPDENDDGGLFDFCFHERSLDYPVLVGGGGVLTSRRRDILGASPLRLAKHTSDRITMEFDIISRPNWPSIAVVQDPSLPTPRVIIRNGVHHMLTLLRSGRPRAFCLIQTGSLGDVGLNLDEIHLFKPNRLLAPRPPLLRDYLNVGCAYSVNMRDMGQVYRFGVNGDLGVYPR